VVTGLSIDNSKNIFFGHLFLVLLFEPSFVLVCWAKWFFVLGLTVYGGFVLGVLLTLRVLHGLGFVHVNQRGFNLR